jgi:CheY-like chemotaxis protein
MSVVDWGEGNGLISPGGMKPTSSFSNGVHATLLEKSIDESSLTSTKSSALPFIASAVSATATAVACTTTAGAAAAASSTAAAAAAQIAGPETLAVPAQSVPTGYVDVATSIPSTPNDATCNPGDTATCFREIISEYLDREEAQLVNGIRVEHLLSKASVTAPSERSPLSALIVDDVLATRKLLSMMLKGYSIISTACCDGLECVNAVRSHEDLNYYDFILLDNTMPVMTGVEASIELRKLGYTNFIVGVTGNSMEAELEEFSGAGADIVLSKPLTKSLISSLTLFFQTCGPKSIPGVKFCFDQQDKLVLKLRKS